MDVNEIIDFYKSSSTEELSAAADKICRKIYGNKVWIRGLLEFSNYCRMDCLYCGIRKSNDKVKRYRLTEEEIVKTTLEAFKAGFRTFVLQSGEDEYFSTGLLCSIIDRIKKSTNCEAAITLSCGIKTKKDLKELKKAGCDRYLIRFETSDPILYSYLRNGNELEKRIEVIRNLKDLGYETGSGYMLGLPGETEEIRINNALLCRELELDMVGIGPFIPHPDTPLADSVQEKVEMTVRATALIRLLLPNANIPATTASGSIDPMGREKMLNAGANVLMPNITPIYYKSNYLLYPGKICLDETGSKCINCLSLKVLQTNKQIDMGKGKIVI